VLAIAGLAKNLGISTTAEGVETAQQLQQVRALGCTEMQGFLFSPPRHIDEIMRLFRPRLEQQEPASGPERQTA
jgi:EAL domain-containing protein (putative c-di-GMP-specific phosphodiesterase class I)